MGISKSAAAIFRTLSGKLLVLLAILSAACVPGTCAAQNSVPGDNPVVQSFKSRVPEEASKNPNVQSGLDSTSEKFAVWIPKDFKEQEGYGLVVFTSSQGTWDKLPNGWAPVLTAHKLLYVAPQNVGNEQPVERRLGMAVVAARAMMLEHKIDPNRVYAAGLSGGARMSGLLGFFEPSVFRGTIQSCGADFYEKLAPVAKRGPDDQTDEYGFFTASEAEVAAAKAQVKFTFITGSKDFRHASIVDIYNEGFAKAGFKAKLFDIKGMEHSICAAKELSAAIDFLDGKPAVNPVTGGAAASEDSGVAANPAGPTWGTLDPKKWPPILAHNDGVLTNNNGIGGSAFLLKLPNNAVVAATALHVFGEGTKAADIDKLVKSWTLVANGSPNRKVAVKKLAMTLDPENPLDCLLASVSPAHSALEALTPRLSPPKPGEVLYVLGFTQEGNAPQIAFKVTVFARDDASSTFQYRFETQVDTMGFSGAPVLDMQGRVVGIHLGHGESADGEYRYGIDIAAPIKQCNAPGMKGDAAHGGVPAVAGGTAPDAAASAAKAASSLAMARNYIAAGKNDSAERILNKIITDYPATPSATEAKALLKSLAGK